MGGILFSPSRPQIKRQSAVEPDEGHWRGGTKNQRVLEEGTLLSVETPSQSGAGRVYPEWQVQ